MGFAPLPRMGPVSSARRCGYIEPGKAKACGAPPAWHVVWTLRPPRESTGLCERHMGAVRASFVYADRHRVAAGCGAPGAVWFDGSACCVPSAGSRGGLSTVLGLSMALAVGVAVTLAYLGLPGWGLAVVPVAAVLAGSSVSPRVLGYVPRVQWRRFGWFGCGVIASGAAVMGLSGAALVALGGVTSGALYAGCGVVMGVWALLHPAFADRERAEGR